MTAEWELVLIIKGTITRVTPACTGLALGFAAAMATLPPSVSLAETSQSDIKTKIVEEVSNKDWQPYSNPYTTYKTGRFSLEGSFRLPESHKATAARLLDLVRRGEFQVIAPTQAGQRLEDLPAYLQGKPACSTAPVRYWDGVAEMTPARYQHLKSRKSSELTPYVPGTPRPIDYEMQINGELEPVARARSNFEFYELNNGTTDSGLRVFRGEDYAPIKSEGLSGHQLEGSFAAFEVPSCRFIGTLDYLTHCVAPHGTPIRQRDERHLAHVIRLDGKPFVITAWHRRCDLETSPNDYGLYLWDLTAPGPIPAIYGFGFRERK